MIINRKLSRRTLLKSAGAGAAATAAGVNTFFGPWRHNRIYAAASDKPLKIGLTHDASGQFANSGQAERRGTLMAIEEFNAKGGVIGRKIEPVWQDTESTPATGSRVAERMITREEVAFVAGALQSGVANAISQVCQKYGVVYFNTNSSSPTESGKNC
ncbi:MAG TPA: ABC transporter substrate-binding protein, partial [bacterium]